MAKTVINIGEANIDVELFATYQTKALNALREEHSLKLQAKEEALDFKETVESVAQTTGLSKGELSAYWKARFEESLPRDDDKKPVGTKVVIDRGELYSVLNTALEV